MSQYKTNQENFWASNFGDEYLTRNQGGELVAGNLVLFSKILSAAAPIRSVIEFGSNIGLNLLALKQLLPGADFSAIEINTKAAESLKQIEVCTYTISPSSILSPIDRGILSSQREY